jgi:hypothetical protein
VSGNDDAGYRDTHDGDLDLIETLHKGMQCFTELLLDRMEVRLHARSKVSSLKLDLNYR